jgi:hypothetical protein
MPKVKTEKPVAVDIHCAEDVSIAPEIDPDGATWIVLGTKPAVRLYISPDAVPGIVEELQAARRECWDDLKEQR